MAWGILVGKLLQPETPGGTPQVGEEVRVAVGASVGASVVSEETFENEHET